MPDDLHARVQHRGRAPMIDLVCHGPYTCPYPLPTRTGQRWTCPNCGSRYQVTRPKPKRWWRSWSAPSGYWRLRWHDRLRLGPAVR
jgi:hypothetical protein